MKVNNNDDINNDNVRTLYILFCSSLIENTVGPLRATRNSLFSCNLVNVSINVSDGLIRYDVCLVVIIIVKMMMIDDCD